MRTPDDIHDEWLVLRCQEGDIAALAELVDRWQPQLLRYAVRLTGLHEAADDVVQATWIAILRGLNRLDDPACFHRWAYQIAMHKSADWIRKRQQDRADSNSIAMESREETTADEHSHDDTAVLREALKQLPHDHRTILTMFYLDDMPLAEIAASLSLPVGTVKSRLHYARLKLKEILEGRNK